MRLLTIRLLALLFAITPAGAQDFGSSYYGNSQRDPRLLLTSNACLLDTSDTTTYNPAAWQTANVGLSTRQSAYLLIGVMGEDLVTNFGVNSVTVDGVPAIELVDEDGTGLVDTAIYISSTQVTAATANISVTFSEAVTGAAICVVALFNNSNIAPIATVVDDDPVGGVLALTINTQTGGLFFGICGNEAPATATWAAGEQNDQQSAEYSVSTAAGGTAGGSLAMTCDFSGTTFSSGSAITID